MAKKTRAKNWIPVVLLFLIFGLIAYFNRWIFYFKFEPEYWENYYYESQWNIPNSNRVIPDGGVYRYIGYRLVNGENPFNVDFWVPPLGKYWYGWGAKYLGNPYLISFGYYIITVGIFWLLAKLILKKEKIIWLSTFIFALNPLLVEQIGQTMLDLPMTIFFMLTIYGLFLATDKKILRYVLFAGVALGLMAGVKPPYFIPMIALIGTGWLYLKKVKKWWYFLPCIVVGYLLAYTCYFIKHPNPIPFIRLHEKIIDFQKNNAGSHDWLNILKVTFLGKYKGHWVNAKTIRPLNWSLILPLGTLSLGWILLKSKKIIKENDKIILLVLLGIGYISMNFLIDFWPRYFMPLIPIFTLIIGYVYNKKPFILKIILIGIIPSLYLFLFPSSDQLLENFNSKQKGGYYRETYRMLSDDTRIKINEIQWKTVNTTIKIEKIVPIKEKNQWKISIKD